MARHAAKAKPHEVDTLAHPVPVVSFAGRADLAERGRAIRHRSDLGQVVISPGRRRTDGAHDSIGLSQAERYAVAISTELVVLGGPDDWGRDTLEAIRLAEASMKTISAWRADSSEALGELVARVRSERTVRRTARRIA